MAGPRAATRQAPPHETRSPHQRRSRPCLLCALLSGLVGFVLVAGGARAASPAPTPPTPAPSFGPSGAPSGPTLTGHWAIPGTSGLDLVQKGSAISGTSPMGVSLAGTINGRQVTFRWWKGASYAKAKPADRGSGIMQASEDWNSLAIAGKDEEAGNAPFPTQYAAVRVVTVVAEKTPMPDWLVNYLNWYDAPAPLLISSCTRAYLDYVVVAWTFALQTGYWPSPAVAWIQVEDAYAKEGRLLIGGWLPNGGGPAFRPPNPPK